MQPQRGAARRGPLRLAELGPQPVGDGEEPPGVVGDGDEGADREREGAGEGDALHEDLAREQEEVRGGGLDPLPTAAEDAVEDVGDGEEEAQNAAGEDVGGQGAVILPEDQGFGLPAPGREGEGGEEVDVSEGEDEEGQVLQGDQAAGVEGDHDGESAHV